MRYRATRRKVFDPHIRAADMGNLGGNFTEGVRGAAHGIESAFTAMSEAKPNQARHIPDIYVVTGFLAPAEEGNFSILDCCPKKSIRTLGIVRVVRAIDRAGVQQAERCF